MAYGTARPGPPVAVQWAVPVVGLLCAWGAVTAAAATGAQITTYAATSSVLLVLDLTAGIGAIAAGTALWSTGRRITGVLAVAIGCAWSAQDWVGQQYASSLVRSTAMVLSPFLLPLLVHLSLAWPGLQKPRRRTRATLAATYGITSLVAVGLAAVRRPLLDRYCWRSCSDNAFLVSSDVDAAGLLEAVRLWSSAAVGLLLMGYCAWVLAHMSQVARRWSLMALGPAALVGAAEATYALLLLRNPAEDPSARLFAAVFVLRATAITAWALGLTWTAWDDVRTRRAVRLVAHQLARAPGPGQLRAALARSLGDAGLQVAYWLAGPGCFVDAEGRHVPPQHPDTRSEVTQITRDGRTVAVVKHDRSQRTARHLQHEIGAALQLAVDNERLRAELLFHLEDLRASQSRIVAQGDATRRRLERDLHDGAQQRLLSVSFELQRAGLAARSRGDDELATAVAAWGGHSALALIELRELAHGIFPAILVDAGLGPALRTFAEKSVLAVEILSVPEGRCQEPVESAAYVVVAEGCIDAARRCATWLTVHVDDEGDCLVVGLEDDGVDRDTASLPHLVDRVGALGGQLHVSASGLRAEIPCG